MVGRLYGLGRAKSRRARASCSTASTWPTRATDPSKTYSGGMRRRLDLAGALVAAPPVLILDEPTTGLDVRSRQQMWDVIRDLVGVGFHACCSRRSTSRRPTCWPTTSWSSTTAAPSRAAPPTSSRRRPAASASRSCWPTPAHRDEAVAHPRRRRQRRGADRRQRPRADRRRRGRRRAAAHHCPPGAGAGRHRRARRRSASPHPRRRVPAAHRPRVRGRPTSEQTEQEVAS